MFECWWVGGSDRKEKRWSTPLSYFSFDPQCLQGKPRVKKKTKLLWNFCILAPFILTEKQANSPIKLFIKLMMIPNRNIKDPWKFRSDHIIKDWKKIRKVIFQDLGERYISFIYCDNSKLPNAISACKVYIVKFCTNKKKSFARKALNA